MPKVIPVSWYEPDVSRRMLPPFYSPFITDRERSVLQQRAHGLTYRAIGNHLGVTSARARQIDLKAMRRQTAWRWRFAQKNERCTANVPTVDGKGKQCANLAEYVGLCEEHHDSNKLSPFLTDRERTALKQRGDGATYRAIGDHSRVSVTRARQITLDAARKQRNWERSNQTGSNIPLNFIDNPQVYNAVRRHYGSRFPEDFLEDIRAQSVHPGSIRNLGVKGCSLLYKSFGVVEPEHPPYSHVLEARYTEYRLLREREFKDRFPNGLGGLRI